MQAVLFDKANAATALRFGGFSGRGSDEHCHVLRVMVALIALSSSERAQRNHRHGVRRNFFLISKIKERISGNTVSDAVTRRQRQRIMSDRLGHSHKRLERFLEHKRGCAKSCLSRWWWASSIGHFYLAN
jgi:hypothetical protein